MRFRSRGWSTAIVVLAAGMSLLAAGFVPVAALGEGVAAAIVTGDGKGRADVDCFIGLTGYAETDLTPFGHTGNKDAIQCTECDPACDRDGAQNGECLFEIGVFLQKTDIPGCDPMLFDVRRVKARARSKGTKIDLVAELGIPTDGQLDFVSPTMVPFPVPLKGKRLNKPGKGKVLLLAKKPTDKDLLRFRCNPLPEGGACPAPGTTTSTSIITTTSSSTSSSSSSTATSSTSTSTSTSTSPTSTTSPSTSTSTATSSSSTSTSTSTSVSTSTTSPSSSTSSTSTSTSVSTSTTSPSTSTSTSVSTSTTSPSTSTSTSTSSTSSTSTSTSSTSSTSTSTSVSTSTTSTTSSSTSSTSSSTSTSTSTSSTSSTSTSTSVTSTTSTSTTTTLQSGCFVDLGDDTIRDTCTGLQWEKKTATGSNAAEPHRENNFYSWAGRCTLPSPDPGLNSWCQPNAAAAATCTAQTGGVLGCGTCGVGEGTCDVRVGGGNIVTTVWDWLNQVNDEALAGHTDWRIATVGMDGDTAELETILLGWPAPSCPAGGVPCIDTIFGPTAAGPHWSATTDAGSPPFARYLNFNTGLIDNPFPFTKESGALVRAVRTFAP